jgi:ABC-type Co2+ transport system permease subunit
MVKLVRRAERSGPYSHDVSLLRILVGAFIGAFIGAFVGVGLVDFLENRLSTAAEWLGVIIGAFVGGVIGVTIAALLLKHALKSVQ